MLTFIGPLPPPLHGQSLVTKALFERLLLNGVKVDAIDTNAGNIAGKLLRHARALMVIWRQPQPVYLSVSSNYGFWLTVTLAAIARLRGRRLVLHYHSFAIATNRPRARSVLLRAAGRATLHLVLSSGMAEHLRHAGAQRTHVLSNAGFVDPRLTQTPKGNCQRIRMGHLSNLSAAKGIDLVIDAACACLEHGLDIELHIAGPVQDQAARDALFRGRKQLGERLEYHGPIQGDQKIDFFRGLDIFLFPTRYRHEAEPMVLLEAIAAGVACISYATGCISEILMDSEGLAVNSDEPFVGPLVAYVAEWKSLADSRQSASRRRFLALLQLHDKSFSEILNWIDQ